MGVSLCLGIFAPMQTYNAIHETYIYIYMDLFVLRRLCSDANT